MVQALLRSIGILLLAVLAAAPVVRTICAWECGPADIIAAAGTAEPGHCVQTSEAPAPGSAGLTLVGGCERCDLIDEGFRATVRTVATQAPMSIAQAWPGTAHVLSLSDLFAAAPPRAASPPLRAPYPLRI